MDRMSLWHHNHSTPKREEISTDINSTSSNTIIIFGGGIPHSEASILKTRRRKDVLVYEIGIAKNVLRRMRKGSSGWMASPTLSLSGRW